MIAFEVMFLLMASIVLIVIIAAVGRPLAEAYSEKLKARYRGIESDEANSFKNRLAATEEEIRQIKNQLINIQDTAEFAVKMIEKKESEAQSSKQQDSVEQIEPRSRKQGSGRSKGVD